MERNQAYAPHFVDFSDLFAALDFYTCPTSELEEYSDIEIRYLGGGEFKLTYQDGYVTYLTRKNGKWVDSWGSSPSQMGYPGN